MEYSNEEIYKILALIFNKDDFNIEPVGNHHLNRHLVYRVDFEDGCKFVFKLYYRKQRRSREIASLRLLEQSEAKVPKIVKVGELEDGHEWLLMEYIEGQLFDSIIPRLSHGQAVDLFEQMGEELGKIHSFKTFDFFGEYDENGKSIRNITDYYQHFVMATERDMEELLSQEIPDKELLMKAIGIIRENYKLLDINPDSRLLHGDFDGRNILVKKEDGDYKISGLIDFEGSSPGNPEANFISLYFRYFLENSDYEGAFLKGYQRYLPLRAGFKDRLYVYLLCFIIANCSWAYYQAPDYYKQNISFVEKLLKTKM